MTGLREPIREISGLLPMRASYFFCVLLVWELSSFFLLGRHISSLVVQESCRSSQTRTLFRAFYTIPYGALPDRKFVLGEKAGNWAQEPEISVRYRRISCMFGSFSWALSDTAGPFFRAISQRSGENKFSVGERVMGPPSLVAQLVGITGHPLWGPMPRPLITGHPQPHRIDPRFTRDNGKHCCLFWGETGTARRPPQWMTGDTGSRHRPPQPMTGDTGSTKMRGRPRPLQD